MGRVGYFWQLWRGKKFLSNLKGWLVDSSPLNQKQIMHFLNSKPYILFKASIPSKDKPNSKIFEVNSASLSLLSFNADS